MQLWLYALPPVAGLVIGYFTNDIAIRMLFRPYRPYHLGSFTLPFTPGVIPQNQSRLAQRIADAIMGSLLTPEELRNIARRILEPERIEAAIRWVLTLALDRLKDPDQAVRATKVLANVLADLFGESLPRLIRALARREDFLEAQLNQIFDQVLLDVRLNQEQAKQVSGWLLEQVIPPVVLRQSLVDFLTDRNITALDEQFRERATGTYWVVANVFGLKNALLRLRSYCLEEPAAAEATLRQVLGDLGAERRLSGLLEDVSLQNLPLNTLRQVRKTMRDSVREYLGSQGPELLQALSRSIDWPNVAGLVIGRLQKSAILDETLDQISADLTQILKRYLDRDLENLMVSLIPILKLEEVIINRVKGTAPQDLERAIQSIVSKELRAIVNLGGALGFVAGCLQALFLWSRSS